MYSCQYLPSIDDYLWHCLQIDEKEYDEESDRLCLLLLTTRSCGLGLNLTAADSVIFVEHDWNPFVDLQAMDRVHRLGMSVLCLACITFNVCLYW